MQQKNPQLSGGGGGSTGGGTGASIPSTGFGQIDKAGQKAGAVLDVGTAIGQQILPEVFPTGGGLERTTFENITPERLNFDSINQYLQPSVDEAVSFRDDTAGRFDEVLGLRRDKLGGLNAAEIVTGKQN